MLAVTLVVLLPVGDAAADNHEPPEAAAAEPSGAVPTPVFDPFADVPDLDGLAVPDDARIADASDAPADPAEVATTQELSLLGLIDKGGVVGYLIIVVSVISLALIIDYLVTIRRARILPEQDVAMLRRLIDEDNLDQLDALDKRSSSYLTRVTVAGLREVHLGYDAMIKAMEDASEALASGIARKTEHLNVIGSISPMLGLLGTVIGMLRVFNEIASTPGAIEPQQLAGGIFEALVTTCLGLIVAIPALYCYAIFRNRVDEYTGEASLAAERLVAGYKQAG